MPESQDQNLALTGLCEPHLLDRSAHGRALISHEVFLTSFCKIQFPHRSVNLIFTLVIVKDKLTDMCGNRLLRNEFANTLCEIRSLTQADKQRRMLVLEGTAEAADAGDAGVDATPRTQAVCVPSASQRSGNNLKGFSDFWLRANARIWP